jgi:DNA (cytosine-5)-methyltransferase 1
MEAASVAWHPLGFKPVAFSEIEPFPSAILKHHFSKPNYPYDVPNLGSLTEYQSWPIEPGAVDLLVGGTPCQSFSVAGLRKGLADPRGNLALTFLGLADKLKPRWIVWENVPGVLSSGGGRDFGSFLGALVELGYGFAYRVLDAQHFGVPQRRRRVFVVACLGDWRAPAEVLSLREGLRGYLETGNKKRKGPAADVGASVEAGCWWDGGQVSQTLDAVLAKGQTMPEKNRFPAVLQPIVIDRAAFNQGENAQFDPHIGESEVMDSLVARGPHAVGVPFRKSKRACSTTDNETWVPADASNTLNNFDLGDTRTTHAVVQPIAFHATQDPISSTKVTPCISGGNKQGCASVGVAQHMMPGSVAPTIGASGPPYSRTGNERVEAEALAVTVHPIIAPCITASNDPSRSPQSSEVTQQVAAVHQATMAVRRLTPTECLRLQGFPDGWSQIPWKGKPASECPDGPQYKAAGNSMAVPVMRWIGERIAAADSTPSSNA